MSKKILVLCSSPVKGGNSDALADAFIEGALEAGHSVERVKLTDHDIHPCLGCDYCRSHDFECIQKDYMQTLYKILEDSDVVVFSTPLYFLTFSAQMKTFIDRLYCKYHGKRIGGKETVLLVSSGGANPASYENLLSTYHAMCKLSNWTNLGYVTVGGFPHDGSIKGSPKLDEARELGRSIK